MQLKKYTIVSKYAEILHMTQFELTFCVCYFILALIICLYSTPRGSLFSPDSVGYVLDAENFLNFFPNYYAGPIYPALIAIFMQLGLTSEQSAGLVPILSYSLLGFPLFLIGKLIIRPLAGYITCVISLLCGKYLLYLSTYAWTDMPYIFFSVITILFISIYKKYGILSSIIFAGIFASLSIYTRIIGIVLIPVGIITIIINNKELKNSFTGLAYYIFLPIALTTLRIIITMRHGEKWLYEPTSRYSPLSPILNLNLFMKFMDRIIYNDYKEVALIVLISVLLIMIYLSFSRQIFIFIKDNIHIISYILLYSIAVILSTANTPISMSIAGFDFRYVVPIFPFIVLFVAILFTCTYDSIIDPISKSIFKLISIILLICIIFQGVNALYPYATNIRTESIAAHVDRDRLDQYMQKYNPTWNNAYIYIIKNNWKWAKYQMEFFSHKRQPKINSIGNISNIALISRIKAIGDLPIYVIIQNSVTREFVQNLSNEICLSDPCRLSDSIIFRINVPENNESCKSCQSSLLRITDREWIIPLVGDFMGKKIDQLLIFTSNLSGMKKDKYKLQMINILSGSSSDISFPEQSDTIQFNLSSFHLIDDFMSQENDQVLYLAGGKIIIEDFRREKSAAIIRYSEALSNSSTLKDLTGPEDSQLVGDFLALGHSQVLFMDRSSNEKRLMLADFTKSKSAQFTEIPLTGDSARIARWLDKDDLQFAGDFMGLGHSQVLFVNRNHTKNEREKLIILDFSNENSKPSIKYQENWGESSSLGGWLDANDTQLVGDFMDLGYSQVLFVNHAKRGGKIAIVDFSKSGGRPPALTKFVDMWNRSDLFEGWLGLNDTRVVGDFKGLGYSQVLFLNSSSNGTNATIVEFASGKPLIAF